MRAHVDLKLEPGEGAALGTLTSEEREAVLDELLTQVRDDLAWVMARAAVAEDVAPRRLRRAGTRG